MSGARRWAAVTSLCAIAIASAATGIGNGFTYDDIPIIAQNGRAHDLAHVWRRFGESYWPPAAGGGRLYRPMPIAAYDVEWALGHGSPVVFHLANILLYAAVTLAVFALARRLMPAPAAWLSAALFAAHPVHAEAVANMVGQAELLAALPFVVAVWYYLGVRADSKTPSPGALGVLGALYLAGCLAKEHAVMLPGVLMAAELTVIDDRRGWRERTRALAPGAVALVAVGVAFLIVRTRIIGAFVGDSAMLALMGSTRSDRVLTMLGATREWLRLLLWPARLAAIYSPPQIAIRHAVDAMVVAGAFVVASCAAFVIVARRVYPVVAFGVAWVAVVLLPVSNLVAPTGILLAERTLFLPSVGLVLAVGGIVAAALPRVRRWSPMWRVVPVVGTGIVLTIGIWRSAIRQPVWRDDRTLFTTTVSDAPESYAAHFAYASMLFKAGDVEAAKREGWLALGLYGGDPMPAYTLGTQYWRAGRCDVAEPMLRQALSLVPPLYNARVKLEDCLMRRKDWAGARAAALVGIERGPNRAHFRQLLASVDSAARASQ